MYFRSSGYNFRLKLADSHIVRLHLNHMLSHSNADNDSDTFFMGPVIRELIIRYHFKFSTDFRIRLSEFPNFSLEFVFFLTCSQTRRLRYNRNTSMGQVKAELIHRLY